MRKELDGALARENTMVSRLQAVEADREKAEAAAKSSVEASMAHLGQLQEVRAKNEGKHRWLHVFVQEVRSLCFCLLYFRPR